jgi:hypothetical protein
VAAASAVAGSIADRARLLYLAQETGDPDVGQLTLGEASALLTDGLERLPGLAKEMVEHPTLDPDATFLVLDHEDEERGADLRPHLPGPGGELTAMTDFAAATPLQDLLEPLTLDPLTAADDDRFVDLLARQKNLPKEVADHVADLY